MKSAVVLNIVWRPQQLAWMVLAWLAGAPACAQVTDWSVGMTAERWQLPADETMGVAGLHFRRAVTDHLRVGVDSFAAVQGQRGGFITLGVGGEYRQPIARRWDLEAGLSVSAGGGRGGRELSGGGLLLREHLGLGYDAGVWRWRVGLSRVDFPNGGTISGTQGYAGFERHFEGLSARLGVPQSTVEVPPAWVFSPTDFGVYGRQYRVGSGSLTDTGLVQANFGVVGAEWRRSLTGPWYAMLDAGGAARGQSNGYMEIMAGLGLRVPLTDRWSVDAGLTAGAGGGGAVDTGGGVLVAARLGLEWRFDGRDALAVGVERMKAPDGHLEASGLSLSLRRRFGPDQVVTVAAHATPALESHTVRMRVTQQQYRAANASWATRPIPNIGVLGVQADVDLDDLWYLTGQGLAAYQGQSGAYMTGLVGAGVHAPIGHGWQVQAEALAGAAGGGGVAVASGAVGQINAGLGYEAANGLGVQVMLGRIRSLHGSFAANVVGLSVTYRTRLFSGAR